MKLAQPPVWEGTSTDPNDEQFGDCVEAVADESAATDNESVGSHLSVASEFDAVLLGEPYDGAVIGRKGAADGPDAIREELAGLKSHHFDSGPVSAIGDLGNVDTRDIPNDNVADSQTVFQEAAGRVYATDTLPVFIGGDNSLTYANASPLLEADTPESDTLESGTPESGTPESGSLGIVSIDAHLDCREVNEGPSSGTPYRQLFDAGLDSLVVVGARDFETSTAYAEYLDEQGGTIVTAETVGRTPDEALATAKAGVEHVDQLYVSVDIDVLDAAYPGSSAPTPGGLQPRELFWLVRDLATDSRIAGFEVVETAPPLDSHGRTVAAAARTIAHFLTGATQTSSQHSQ